MGHTAGNRNGSDAFQQLREGDAEGTGDPRKRRHRGICSPGLDLLEMLRINCGSIGGFFLR